MCHKFYKSLSTKKNNDIVEANSSAKGYKTCKKPNTISKKEDETISNKDTSDEDDRMIEDCDVFY